MGGGALLFISLLNFIGAQGLQHVFVLHGKDLYLELQKPVVIGEDTDLFWKFNTINNIGKVSYNRKPVIFSSYEGRAELFGQNYLLLLKKVQHSDSGDYTAVEVGGKDQRVAEYKVTVQDPVTPVNLTVTPSSSDPCDITVTCRTLDLKISSTFRCEAQNCSQVEEKSLNATKNFSSLTVYLQQGTIFCNHSNKVNWKHKVAKLQCETTPVLNKATIAGISTGVIFVLTAVAVYCAIRKCKRKNTESTIYEVPQDILPDQSQHQTVSGDASCQSSTTTYAMVEFHTGPKPTKTNNTPHPESVYAHVNRAAKPESTDPTTNTQS